MCLFVCLFIGCLQMLSCLEYMYHDLGLVKEFNMNPITLKRWLVRWAFCDLRINWSRPQNSPTVSLPNQSWQFKKTTATTLSTTSVTVFVWARWCMEWSICVTLRWGHGDTCICPIETVLVCVCQINMPLVLFSRRGWLWQTCVFWWLQQCVMTWTTRDTTTRMSLTYEPSQRIIPLTTLFCVFCQL